MDRKTQAGTGPAVAFAAAIGLGLTLAVAGCLPNRSADVRDGVKDAAVTPASLVTATATATPAPAQAENQGRLIAPRRCGISIAILGRPAKDPALNEVLWGAADEQAIPLEALRMIEANGLRVGLIAGSLPVEVQGVLEPPPPAKKVDIVSIDQPDGESTAIDLAAVPGAMTLLLNRDGRTYGKDYDDAKGLLRLTATHDDAGGVKLKLVPEIRHGPMTKGYAVAPSGPFQPQEFMIKEGQAEESFRDLAITVTIRPGQVVAIGGRGEARGLGGFLFTRADTPADHAEQRVVLIWAQPGPTLDAPEARRRLFSRDDRGSRGPARPQALKNAARPDGK